MQKPEDTRSSSQIAANELRYGSLVQPIPPEGIQFAKYQCRFCNKILSWDHKAVHIKTHTPKSTKGKSGKLSKKKKASTSK